MTIIIKIRILACGRMSWSTASVLMWRRNLRNVPSERTQRTALPRSTTSDIMLLAHPTSAPTQTLRRAVDSYVQIRYQSIQLVILFKG